MVSHSTEVQELLNQYLYKPIYIAQQIALLPEEVEMVHGMRLLAWLVIPVSRQSALVPRKSLMHSGPKVNWSDTLRVPGLISSVTTASWADFSASAWLEFQACLFKAGFLSKALNNLKKLLNPSWVITYVLIVEIVLLLIIPKVFSTTSFHTPGSHGIWASRTWPSFGGLSGLSYGNSWGIILMGTPPT